MQDLVCLQAEANLCQVKEICTPVACGFLIYGFLSEQTDPVFHCREDKEVETAPSAAASPLIPTDGQQVPRLPFHQKEVHAIPSSVFFLTLLFI
jgi:hypothetical protein